MALLADATVIVEATEASGTMHHGWEAIRLGRPVLFPSSFRECVAPRVGPRYDQSSTVPQCLKRETLERVIDEMSCRSVESLVLQAG